MSAKEEIIKRLQFSPTPIPVHEMKIVGYNDNNLATRCNELEREGKLWSGYKEGARYKIWWNRPWTPEHRGELF